MTGLEHAAVEQIVELSRRQGFVIKAKSGVHDAWIAQRGKHSVLIAPSKGHNAMEKCLAALRRAGAQTHTWRLPGQAIKGVKGSPKSKTRPHSARPPTDHAIPARLIGRTVALPLPDNIVATAQRHHYEWSAQALDECREQEIGVFEAIAAIVEPQATDTLRGGLTRYVRGDLAVLCEQQPASGVTIHSVIDLGRLHRANPRTAQHPVTATLAEVSPMDKAPATAPQHSAAQAVTGHIASQPAGTRITLADLCQALPAHTRTALYQAARKANAQGLLTQTHTRPAVWEVRPMPDPADQGAALTSTPPADAAAPGPDRTPDAAGGASPDQPEPAASEAVTGPLATVHPFPTRPAPGGVEHVYDLGAPPPDEPDPLAVALGQFALSADKLRREEPAGQWARLARLTTASLPPELDDAGMRLTVQLVPSDRGIVDVYARWTRL